MKKVGREMPASAMTEITLSVVEYCFVAAMMPSGIEISISSIITISPIQNEMPTTCANFWVTGTVYFQLSPKSRRTAFESQEAKPGIMPLSIP